ncbi:hypothetical protein ANN_10834 [Periplaneta americana]|uniref:DUF4371 domain-containing protein n=1 Tax=Periplaneta americana TaxID=6978 RepID=A0ABQ8T5N9_PERAM|nr:hypothetical protein ANN_10834 [Periplaneta americana]
MKKSVSHINAYFTYKEFGKGRVDLALNEHGRLKVENHNTKEKRNHEVLKCLINVVCFLDTQELPFRGHREDLDSLNHGNYIYLINLIAEYENLLTEHLSSSTIVSGMSSDIQNDITQSVCNVLLGSISKEIQAAPFIAILLDEASDVSNKSQLSTVIRYVSPSSGEVSGLYRHK